MLKNKVSRLVGRAKVADKFTNLTKAVLKSHCVPNVVTLKEVAYASWRVSCDLASPVAHIRRHKESLGELEGRRDFTSPVVLTDQLVEGHFLKGVHWGFLSLLLLRLFLGVRGLLDLELGLLLRSLRGQQRLRQIREGKGCLEGRLNVNLIFVCCHICSVALLCRMGALCRL